MLMLIINFNKSKMDAKICTFCALDVAVGALLWTILSNKLILQPLQLPKFGHKIENPKKIMNRRYAWSLSLGQ